MFSAPLEKSMKKNTKGYGSAGHALGWMAVLTLVFSGATITLAAMAQSTGSAECTRNSYANLRCLSRDLGGVMDTVNTKFDRALAKTEACTASDEGCRRFATASELSEEAGEQRGDTTPPQDSPPPANPTQPTDNPPPSNPPPVPNAQPNPPPNPQPGPQNPQKHQICLQQCKAALDACIVQTNKRSLLNNGADDPFCIENHNKECVQLCNDWYNSPVVTKPPVPPIESQDQTCLINCRTQMSLCSQAVDTQFQVTPWQPGPPPPQAYFDGLKQCVVQKDNECRAQCRFWNPSSIAPTQ